jgi:hypothetical protein
VCKLDGLSTDAALSVWAHLANHTFCANPTTSECKLRTAVCQRAFAALAKPLQPLATKQIIISWLHPTLSRYEFSLVPFLRLYSTSYFSRSLHTPRRHLMFFVTGRHTTPSIGTFGSGGICKVSDVKRQGWRGSRAGGSTDVLHMHTALPALLSAARRVCSCLTSTCC